MYYILALVLFFYFIGFKIKIFWMQEYVVAKNGETISCFKYLKTVIRYFYYKKVREHFLSALKLCIKTIFSVRISVEIGV